jgi:hypothetical protein
MQGYFETFFEYITSEVENRPGPVYKSAIAGNYDGIVKELLFGREYLLSLACETFFREALF